MGKYFFGAFVILCGIAFLRNDKTTEALWITNHYQPAADTSAARNPEPVRHRPSPGVMVFPADIPGGLIGRNGLKPVDDAFDNIFHVQLPELPGKDKAVYLQYELFGVRDLLSVARSINDAQALGGHFVAVSRKWSLQKEPVSRTTLKPGDNTIRFSIPANSNYCYQVKNVALVVEERDAQEAIVLGQAKGQSGEGYAYMRGVLNEPVRGLFYNGQPIAVHNNEFEIIVPGAVRGSHELKALLKNGRTETKGISFVPVRGEGESYDVPAIRTVHTGTYHPARVFQLGDVLSASISIPAGALRTEETVGITALRDIDLAPLNPELVNVTSGAAGFRFSPHRTALRKDARLGIPFDKSLIPEGYTAADIRTYYFDETSRKWIDLPLDSASGAADVVFSRTNGFRDVINGIIKVPESPQTQGYTPTSIKDIKAANPSLGINFIKAPQANSSGTASLAFELNLPKGRAGMQPQLTLQYSNESANGWMGIGWNLAVPSIGIETRWGVPRYDAALETETYVFGGEQLAPLAHRGAFVPRTAEKQFHPRVEGSFRKIIRHGSSPANYWWEVIDKDGTRSYYGGMPVIGVLNAAVLKDDRGNIAHWALLYSIDLNGNYTQYSYTTVTDNGVAGGSVPGRQLYLSSIQYTGHGSDPGLYRVEFVRDRQLSEPRRKDVEISARTGFKMVTADLLRRISITCSNKPVRSYDIQYAEGAFYKTLLASISELDAAGTVFYSHQFGYYNDVTSGSAFTPFGSWQSWSLANDNIKGDIRNPISGFTGEASALNAAKSSHSNSSLSVGLGIWDGDFSSKSNTVGGNFGSGSGSTEGMVSLIDINGDGLPDKLFKKGGQLFYRPNAGRVSRQFGGARPVTGVSNFSSSRSKTSSRGVEANILRASWSRDNSNTVTTTREYLSDFNGDGLMDVANNGRAYFNRLDANGNPLLLPNSTQTPNPLLNGSSINPVFLAPDLALQQQQEKDYPLQDIIRFWEAPFDGTINVAAPVQLLNVNTSGTGNPKLDGVRVSVQLSGAVLWSATIPAGDFSVKTPSGLGSLPVQKGQRLYFRVQSIYNGEEDEVSWDPLIRYTNILSPGVDANRRLSSEYRASSDFVLTNTRPMAINKSGSIQIDGRFIKKITSDSVWVRIIKKTGSTEQVLGQWLYACKMQANTNLAVPSLVNVNAGDSLRFVLYTDSYIDRAAVQWTPHFVYTSFTDGTPAVNLNGQPTMESYVVPDNSNYNDWVIRKPLLSTAQNDTVSFRPLLTAGATANGVVNFTVRGFDTVYGKRSLQIVNGAITGSGDSIHVKRKVSDTLFCEFHIADRSLALSVATAGAEMRKDTVYIVSGNPVDSFVKRNTDASVYTNPAEEFLGSKFRGWGHFSFKGDAANGPIDETKINLNGLANYSSDPNLYTDTSLLNQIVDVSSTEFIPLYPNSLRESWLGFDTGVYVSPARMGSARLWMHDVSVDSVMSGISLAVANKISEAKSTSYSLGITTVNGSATRSTTTTVNKLDMMDMNGDRYPDVLHKNDIQYTLPGGGLQAGAVFHNLGEARFSGQSKGVSLGRSVPQSSGKGSTPSNAQSVSSNAGSALGISGNASVSNSDDEIEATWMDMNGDGLPDKLYKDGRVRLNLGYRFAAAENWGIVNIDRNETDQFSAGTSFGYNLVFGSIQGGFSLLRTNGDGKTQFNDLNGDNLVDQINVNGSAVTVRLNNGHGFGPPTAWQGLGFARKNSSTGESVNAAFTHAFPIPLFFIVLKFAYNPSWSSGNGVSRENELVMDVDGDGFADLLSSDDDGDLEASLSTIGRTNMLRTVSQPMGSTLSLDYERQGNTYELPNAKWTLKTVEITDGLKGDGVDTMRYRYTYEEGHYDRYEREFYGFRKVKTDQLNTAAGNVVYRSTVQQFLNNDYYTRNLLQQEYTTDAAGKKFVQTSHQYALRTVQSNVIFPALAQVERQAYEGNTSPGPGTVMRFEYDPLGNMTRITDMGDGSAQDMTDAIVRYHDNDPLYIKDIPSSIEVTTAEGLKRKRTAVIDNAGNVTQINQFLADGSSSAWDFQYDVFGNISRVTRPENHKGQRLWYRYEYDADVHTYVTKVADSYGYESSSSYDIRFGELTQTTSIQNQRILYQYDNSGRLRTLTGPYELAAGKPYTILFDYYPHAAVPYALTRHYDPEHNGDISTFTFMDGLQRPVQVKKQASIFKGRNTPDEVRMTVSGKNIHDAFGRVVQAHFPVTEIIGPQNSTYNTQAGSLMEKTDYDVLDRELSTVLADGATTTSSYSISNGYLLTVTKDPLQLVREVSSDIKGRERIATVLGGPAGPITTRFFYNALDELVRVTDAGGNSTQMGYDNLGRKISENHPDAGLTELVYDLAGNLVKKITPQIRKEIPNGGAVQYGYDFERLVDIDYPRQYQNKVTYTYGKPGSGNRTGRLVLQQDASGGQEFYYGPLGEVTKTIRTVLVNSVFFTTYVSEQEYDTWNRLKKMVYPDGETLVYRYNKGGGLNSISGHKLGNDYKYVNQVGYDEYEQRVYLQYGNGTETNYSYDAQRRRLQALKVINPAGREIVNNSYSYDAVSNVLSITNDVQPVAGKLGGYAQQNFAYDNLYRLRAAKGQYKGAVDSATYTLGMEYDNLYNITSKRLSRSQAQGSYNLLYTYGGKPHQPTEVGGNKYKYDLNGNLQSHANQQYFWDEDNRLMAVIGNAVLSRYTYDGSGERVIKSSGGLQGIWVNGAPAGLINHDSNYTVYVSPYLVCRRTSFTKHIYIEDQRIVSKLGIGNFTNISFPMPALTAGGIDYVKRAANIQRQRLDYYSTRGISPGPPTDKYFYAHPYNSGIAAPVIVDSTSASIPPGWPGNTTPPVNGPPIFVSPIPSNDSVKAGYGFRSTGHFAELNQSFYHPDHLGSTSYVTDVLGEVSQHQEYVPFGETFFEEHTNSNKTPYLFNAKERDVETGLYYYGARYYDPRISLWASVDPMAGKYPGLSPYNYCLNNPVKMVDPDGKLPKNMDWKAAGKAAAINVGAGIIAGAAATAIGITVGPVVGAGLIAYGLYETGKTGYEIFSGREAFTNRQLSDREQSERIGGLVGVPTGAGAALSRGGKALVQKAVVLGEKRLASRAASMATSTAASTATKTAAKALKFGGDEAVIHFGKHADQIMKVTGQTSYNLKNYVDDANWIIQNGRYSPKLNGFYHYMGNSAKGESLFGFVGLKNGGANISTFHIKTATQLGLKE
jgi:RHS repeat-associated protein